MSKWMRMGAVLIVFGLVAATAGARDDNRGRWWRIPEVAQKLTLTEEEISRLDAAFEDSRMRMIELKGRLEVEQQKLRALMERPDLDEAAIRDQHRRQEAARAELAGERFEFLLNIRKIVGYERFVQLLEMRDERRRERRLKRGSKPE